MWLDVMVLYVTFRGYCIKRVKGKQGFEIYVIFKNYAKTEDQDLLLTFKVDKLFRDFFNAKTLDDKKVEFIKIVMKQTPKNKLFQAMAQQGKIIECKDFEQYIALKAWKNFDLYKKL